METNKILPPVIEGMLAGIGINVEDFEVEKVDDDHAGQYANDTVGRAKIIAKKVAKNEDPDGKIYPWPGTPHREMLTPSDKFSGTLRINNAAATKSPYGVFVITVEGDQDIESGLLRLIMTAVENAKGQEPRIVHFRLTQHGWHETVASSVDESGSVAA